MTVANTEDREGSEGSERDESFRSKPSVHSPPSVSKVRHYKRTF
jgi:hypothetical protein